MLSRLFLESPIFVIAVLVAGTAVAAWRYLVYRRHPALYLLVGLPTLAVLIAIIAAVIVTDREQITASWRRVEQAFAERNAESALKEVSSGFKSDGLSRDNLVLLSSSITKILETTRPAFYLFSVSDVSDTRATATVWVRVSQSPAARGLSTIDLQWQLNYAKDSDGHWRISGAKNIVPGGVTIQDGLKTR